MSERRDFKLLALVPLHSVTIRDALFGSARPQDRIPSAIKTDGIRQTASAFFQNVTRLDDTSIGMPLLVFMAEHLGRHQSIGMSWGEVRVKAGYVGIKPAGSEAPDVVDEPQTTFFGRYWETVDEYLAAFPETANGIWAGLFKIETWSPMGDSAIDAWLSAIVTGTWTTFEVLATDLWECALNCHPHGLTNFGDRMVGVKVLQKYGYDLKSSMGTILKDKLGARGLEDIRSGYRSAFADNHVNIDKAIGDNSLSVIQAVRSAIVHRAGIVDERFCEQARAMPLLSNMKPGDRILLDGELVKSLVEPVIQCSLDLLLAVDRWLQNH